MGLCGSQGAHYVPASKKAPGTQPQGTLLQNAWPRCFERQGGAKVVEELIEFDAKRIHDFDVGFPPPIAVAASLEASPPRGSLLQVALSTHFPGAIPGSIVLQRSVAVLRTRGLNPANTIYGQSICPDEINNEKGDLASLMQEFWGECFPMGGIGGAPFVGKTGFMAFSHHVPEDGHVLILFGPHIAISDTGELGKYKRYGQENHSCACGAVLGAYHACVEGKEGHAHDDPEDMQQSWIKRTVAANLSKIQAAAHPIAALTYSAYEAIKEKMLAVVNHSYGSGKLILIGGIQINLPAPYEDHFCPLFFRASSSDSEPEDLLASTFTFSPTFPPADPVRSRSATLVAQNLDSQVYGWLQWAPMPGSPCFNAIHSAFPGALPGQVVSRRCVQILNRLGIVPENSIYGSSICPDEINNEKGDLANRMMEHWGHCFPMGGIGGAPYVGKQGFECFSHHVPESGNIVVFFGSHVAVSEDGQLGKYLRCGQKQHSPACRAVLNAYDLAKSGAHCCDADLDMQQAWLHKHMCRKVDEIDKAQYPLAAVTQVAYEAAKEKMLAIVNHDFGSGKLVLIGGIQINCPRPFEDHFQPLFFQLSGADGSCDNVLSELTKSL